MQDLFKFSCWFRPPSENLIVYMERNNGQSKRSIPLPPILQGTNLENMRRAPDREDGGQVMGPVYEEAGHIRFFRLFIRLFQYFIASNNNRNTANTQLNYQPNVGNQQAIMPRPNLVGNWFQQIEGRNGLPGLMNGFLPVAPVPVQAGHGQGQNRGGGVAYNPIFLFSIFNYRPTIQFNQTHNNNSINTNFVIAINQNLLFLVAILFFALIFCLIFRH